MPPTAAAAPAAGATLAGPAEIPAAFIDAFSAEVPPAAGTSNRPADAGGTPRDSNRGTLWVIGSFLLCPCHLPVTLALLGVILSGTVAGAALHRYPLVAAAIITLAWALGTGRGLRLLRSGTSCPIR